MDAAARFGVAVLVRAGIRALTRFFSCIARLPASHEAGYRWRAHENLWRSLRELRSLPGEGGDPALRPEEMLHCRADKIDLRGGVVRTNREAEDFVGEPFGEWEIAALPAGVAVGV